VALPSSKIAKGYAKVARPAALAALVAGPSERLPLYGSSAALEALTKTPSGSAPAVITQHAVQRQRAARGFILPGSDCLAPDL
jgi:hypothetical protein